MEENKELKENVNKLVEDLQKKIDGIKEAGKNSKNEKVEEIVGKVADALNSIIDKIVDVAKDSAYSQEVLNSIDFVKAKSKTLYEEALKKIEEIKKDEKVNEAIENVTNVTKKIADSVTDNEFVKAAENSIYEFKNKPEVKNAIDRAKHSTVEVAEKALSILKDWLEPEDENK